MKNLIYALSIIILFSFISSGDAFAQQKQKANRMHFRENMIEKMNLSEEQKDKIAELRSKNQKEMIDLRAELQKKMIDKRELRRNTDLTRAQLISAVKEVNGIKDQIAVARANHQMDVYELLTPEQKKIWQENKPMMRDHMKMKFKDGNCGHGKFNRGEFGPPHDFDDDEPGPDPDDD